jgi:hypothetical protein
MPIARSVGSLAFQFYRRSAALSVAPALLLSGALGLGLSACSEPKADPAPDVRPVDRKSVV